MLLSQELTTVETQEHTMSENTGSADSQNEDISSKKSFSNILRVKADPPGISNEDRASKTKALAGAIAHGLRQYGEVKVRCVGDASIAKASVALATASGFVAVHGFDLYCRPSFISVEMADKTMTGICFIVVTSQTKES